jgi:micrococcal nuclease
VSLSLGIAIWKASVSPKANPFTLAAVAILFALLTRYVHAHENADTFVIYAAAMALCVLLFGYCLWNGRKRAETATAPAPVSAPKRRPSLLAPLSAGLAVGASVGLAILYPPNLPALDLTSLLPTAFANPAPRFSLCVTGSGTNCVVDGDMFWNEGVQIRVADIDSPEIHPPRCTREADLGHRAALRLQELLNEGRFQLQTKGRDQDRHRHKLRVITRDGQSLGLLLVNEGLARKRTGKRQSWC